MNRADDIVLKVENIGKDFKIYPSPLARLKEWAVFGKRKYHKDFWALKNVSFEVRRGGFLGIIGPNGAGKSTLLKVITGVMEPSAGTYWANGKVLSLLELSGGMEGELSGRENIIRSVQLLGFPASYIEERMDDIKEFAELGEFFDQPMRVYSSGMRIRLAFSMFAFMECDVLILDEVLAVGDIFFRQKCYARLQELIKQNVSIVLVTHSTGTIRQYCDDVIVLDKGEVVFHGAANQAIQTYFQIKKGVGIQLSVDDTFVEEDFLTDADTFLLQNEGIPSWPSEKVFLRSPLPETEQTKGITLTHLAVCDESGQPRQFFKQGEKAFFYYAFRINENMGVPVVRLLFKTVQNSIVHSKSSLQYKTDLPLRMQEGDTLRFMQAVQLDLSPRNYTFDLEFFTLRATDYAQIETLSTEEMKELLVPVQNVKPAGVIEVIQDDHNSFLAPHGGLCNLPGEFKVHVLGSSQVSSERE